MKAMNAEAIDLRWTLKDIVAKRWMITPVNPDHLKRLIDLELVEMRNEEPYVTPFGQKFIWKA